MTYLSHLYVGVGEPSSETQVMLILCPYSAVPTTLQLGCDGATVKNFLDIHSTFEKDSTHHVKIYGLFF